MRKLKGTLIMVGECVRMSLANIRGSKVRSFLTVLGIMIGVTAVIALITTVNGVTGSISDSFLSMGAGTLTVTISGSDLKAGLSQADLLELTELTQVDGLTPTVTLSSRVSRGGSYESRITVSGKNAYYFRIHPELVLRGRALNFIDEDNMSFVCLIDQTMIDSFFFGVDPVGERIYVDGIPFLVAGTFSAEGTESVASIFTHLFRRGNRERGQYFHRQSGHSDSLYNGTEDEQCERSNGVYRLFCGRGEQQLRIFRTGNGAGCDVFLRGRLLYDHDHGCD